MVFFRFLSSFIAPVYSQSEYLVKRKALVLYYFVLCTAVVLLGMIGVFLALQPVSYMRSVTAIGTLIVLELAGILVLRTGRYYLAANYCISVTAALLTVAQFAKLSRDPHTGYTSFFYLMLVVVVMAALFCSRKWLFGVALFFVCADVTFFVLVGERLDPLGLEAARVGVVDSVFTFVIVTVLSYMIVRITEGAARRSDREARKSMEGLSKIQDLLESVAQSSGVLARSSADMREMTVNFSENFQSQATSAEEITAAMEEVSTSADHNANSSSEQYEIISAFLGRLGSLSETISLMGSKIRESIGVVNEITDLAKSGGSSLNSMQTSMDKIRDGSDRMTGILEIINSISDKINLLSLNAAIEAARAGDAGRGFAVVADEISKLADQTASSLKEIDGLIKQNMGEISKGSDIMNDTFGTINHIISGVGTMSGKISEIAGYMSQQDSINQDVNEQAATVKDRSSEIKSASQEQKTASDEIVKSITSVNEITQRNSEILAGLMKLAEEVSGMADHLEGKVSGA